MDNRGAEAGFTVLELMVGLCILALLSTYVVQALHQVRRMEIVTEQLEAKDSINAVQQHLVQLLSGARAIVVSTDGQSPVMAFAGDHHRVEAIAASDGTLEKGGLYRVEITVRRREDGLFDLVTRRTAYRSGLLQNSEPELLLLERIEGLHLRYFGPSREQQGASWQPEWRNRSTLPKLIEMMITLPQGERRRWQRLVIQPVSSS